MSSGTALVIGASSQVRRHVAQALRDRGWRVVGTGDSRADPGLLSLDLRDEGAVRLTIEQVRPRLCVLAAALILNVTGAEVTDRVTFARLAAATVGLAPKLVAPIQTSELGQRA